MSDTKNVHADARAAAWTAWHAIRDADASVPVGSMSIPAAKTAKTAKPTTKDPEEWRRYFEVEGTRLDAEERRLDAEEERINEEVERINSRIKACTGELESIEAALSPSAPRVLYILICIAAVVIAGAIVVVSALTGAS